MLLGFEVHSCHVCRLWSVLGMRQSPPEELTLGTDLCLGTRDNRLEPSDMEGQGVVPVIASVIDLLYHCVADDVPGTELLASLCVSEVLSGQPYSITSVLLDALNITGTFLILQIHFIQLPSIPPCYSCRVPDCDQLVQFCNHVLRQCDYIL